MSAKLPGFRSQGFVLAWSLIAFLSISVTAAPAFGQARASTGAQVSTGAQASAAQDWMDEHGIKVRNPGKNVLFGSVRRCKTPAVVDYKKALSATPEARKIKDDGIHKGSAEYAMLKQKAVKRLKRAIRALAVQEGRDCVVKKGCIRSKGADVVVADLTSKIVSKMEAAQLS